MTAEPKMGPALPQARKRGRRPALPGVRAPKAGPDENNANEEIAAMIRVDHAGEFGAMRIYAGQLAVLGHSRHEGSGVTAIRRMAEQERQHFDTFDRMIKERAVRPTALEPVWRVAGYALGAATALMGEKAAMACTVAVEDVIDAHYEKQIERLSKNPQEADLARNLERFRADERAHRDQALAHDAQRAPFYPLLLAAIKLGCRAAIGLSHRL